jgi:hypothetical protein
MSRHRSIKQDLSRMLPGASWHPWVATVPEDLLATKTDTAAARIREHLACQESTRIGLKTLKAAVEKVMGQQLSPSTFQAARDLAIEDSCWSIEQQSLVRHGDPGGGD